MVQDGWAQGVASLTLSPNQKGKKKKKTAVLPCLDKIFLRITRDSVK
jgi:hypothetical protein